MYGSMSDITHLEGDDLRTSTQRPRTIREKRRMSTMKPESGRGTPIDRILRKRTCCAASPVRSTGVCKGPPMISLFIENLAIALLSAYPTQFFATLVLRILDPFYQWAVNRGL